LNKKNSRLTLLWLLMYGFGIIAFGIFLLAIGSGIRVFLIFTIIGLSLVALWLYFNARPKNQKKNRLLSNEEKCICPICNHEVVKICLRHRCPCCIAMKGDSDSAHTG
jgi:hypothetical protein